MGLTLAESTTGTAAVRSVGSGCKMNIVFFNFLVGNEQICNLTVTQKQEYNPNMTHSPLIPQSGAAPVEE